MDFVDSNAVDSGCHGVGVVGCGLLAKLLVAGEQWRSEIRVKREGVDDELLRFTELQMGTVHCVMRVDTREKSSELDREEL